MTLNSVLNEVKHANVRYKVISLPKDTRILVIPTLLDGELVYFVGWIEGNKRVLLGFFQSFARDNILIYRDFKGIWKKRSILIDKDLYKFKGF